MKADVGNGASFSKFEVAGHRMSSDVTSSAYDYLTFSMGWNRRVFQSIDFLYNIADEYRKGNLRTHPADS